MIKKLLSLVLIFLIVVIPVTTQAALTDNLVAYYEMEGNANDYTGNHNGTSHNITYNASYGKIDQGGSFNGTSSYISVTHNSSLNITSAITLGTWVKLNSLTGNPGQRFISKWDGSATWFLQSVDATGWAFYLNAGGSTKSVTTNTNYNTTSWHFIVATYDGSNMKIYVDGNYITQTAQTGSISTNSHALYLGVNENLDGQWLNGYLDEPFIYSRALSATEISTLYNSGSGLQPPFTISLLLMTDFNLWEE